MPNRTNQPTASTNVYIASLPTTFTDQQLHDLLAPFGRITSARVMCDPKTGQCKGYGFVLFENDKSAAAAIQGLSGHAIEGHRIQVRLAHLAASPLANRPEIPQQEVMGSIGSPIPYAALNPELSTNGAFYSNAPHHSGQVQFQLLQLPPGASMVITATPTHNGIQGGVSTLGVPNQQYQVMHQPQHNQQQHQQTVFVLQSAPSGEIHANQNVSPSQPFYHGQIIYPTQHSTFHPF
jgi:RNA recognition motif-containing protein